MTQSSETILKALVRNAEARPDAVAFRFLVDVEAAALELTYRQLLERSLAAAGYLGTVTLEGDRVLLLLEPGLEFPVLLYGCLLAGRIPVPLYPPRSRRRVLQDLLAVARDCAAAAAVASPFLAADLPGWLREHFGGCELVVHSAADVLQGSGSLPALKRASPEDVAFLQYTSGSTGMPKGVIVSHRNVVANLEMIRNVFEQGEASSGVLWLPPYHDMGLIGGIMQPVYLGRPMTLMAPAAFVQRPARWLQAISKYRATTSGGPNFGYELCVQRVEDEDLPGLDLSSWTVAFNGAEPVQHATLRRFAERFERCGFRASSFCPCYGMAETTLLVSGVRKGVGITVAAPGSTAGGAPPARPIVSCGRPADGAHVLIVDPERREPLQDGAIGEIWIRSPSVSRGYWNRPELTREVFEARLADGGDAYFRTGDLGFCQNGEIHVTGRIKDLVIVRGKNYHPHDIERVVEASHPALRLGHGAAFGVERDGEEGLVIVQELERTALRDLDAEAAFAAIRREVADAFGLQIDAIVLVRPATIPKTSSGKIRRSRTRSDFLAGELLIVARWDRAGAAAPCHPEPSSPPEDCARRADGAADRQSSASEPIDEASARRTLMGWLRARIAERAGIAIDAVHPSLPLASLGLDSRAVVELSAEVEKRLGRKFPPQLLYAYPTLEALSQSLFDAPGLGAQPLDSSRRAGAPIAIVGMACRFPGGADDPERYWRLLVEGRDTVGPAPQDRWPEGALAQGGARPSQSLGAIDRVFAFDPTFFGISPREAASMDPQQRLLLLTSWEALEDALIDPRSLRGGAVGVFTGLSATDHAMLHYAAPPRVRFSAHAATGNANSIAAGRISYVLGLRGPSLVVDTACSSSLVAVHLACASLRAGECELALAGGVNVVLTPEPTIALALLGALSPTGRCRAFSADADGYVRAEGAGMVVLKPLDRALADGDPVVAVIHGSAVNHDGASNGLTAPSGPAQKELIVRALRDARVSPETVAYVEAHGTGTLLGDPIEADAIRAGYELDRGSSALAIGSVKTNLGHLEAASGVAGLLKVALAARYRVLPPSLHWTGPNPHIDWRGLEVVTEPRPWPADRAYAGVSSFGLSGTNAHVIVGPPPSVRSPESSAVRLEREPGAPEIALVLSARTPTALSRSSARLAERIEQNPQCTLGDFAATLAHGRGRFEERAVVVAGGAPAEAREQAIAALRRLAADADGGHPGVIRGHASPESAGVAFLFTGQGAQRAGMGRKLYDRWPVFRETIDRCEAALLDRGEPPLRRVMFDEDPAMAALLDDTRYAQPALFALEVALARLWGSFGVHPQVVAGHSIGELAAACVAGVFEIEDGIRLASLRGRLMGSAPGSGAMLSVRAAAPVVQRVVDEVVGAGRGPLVIAAYNAPEQQIVSGDLAAIEELARRLAGRKISSRRLQVSHAFHSPLMDPVLDELARSLEATALRPPRIPVLDLMEGDGEARCTEPAYWRAHVRASIRFADGIGKGHERFADVRTWIEIGPDAVLSGLVRQSIRDPSLTCIPSMRAGGDEPLRFVEALAAVAARAHVDWSPLYPRERRRSGVVPTYAFDLADYKADVAVRVATEAPSGLHYELQWERRDEHPAADRAGESPASWIVAGGPSSLRETVCHAFVGARIPCQAAHDLPAALEMAPADHVLWLGGLEAGPPEARLVALVEALRHGKAAPRRTLPKIWLVTRGAVAEGGAAVDPDAASLWGFGRCAALELPDRWGGAIDLDPRGSHDPWPKIADFLGGAPEDQAALRSGELLVPRLVPSALASRTWQPPAGAALITGGLGHIGLELARWLWKKGVEELVLTASGEVPSFDAGSTVPEGHPRARAARVVGALREQGARVRVVQTDVSDARAMGRLVQSLEDEGCRLGVIFHLAGRVERKRIEDLGADDFARALAPKLAGARAVASAASGRPPLFVMFGSIAAVWGSAELAAYAAANAGMDAFGAELRSRGVECRSIAWGPWADGGMVSAESAEILQRAGLRLLRGSAALDALDAALASGAAEQVIAELDPARFSAAMQARRPLPMLARLAPPADDTARAERAAWVEQIRGAPAAERRAQVIERIRRELARLLALPSADAVDSRRGLQEQGLDSFMATELRLWAERTFGLTLATTMLFDVTNVEELADRLLSLLEERRPAAHAAPSRSEQSAAEPIAIVGLACRFPGGATDPERLWSLLVDKRDAVTRVPADRWDPDALFDGDPDAAGRIITKQGAFLEDIDKFDATFFRLSPAEASAMDPQQRLALEVAWEALEHAALSPDTLRQSATGVFLGIGVGDYQRLGERLGAPIDRHSGTGTSFCFAAGRISHALGLQGPSVALDTACSSSLVAVHLACQSLRCGESRVALAGGVNAMLTPDASIFLSRARALAPDGRCRTFDAAAQGYGRGEGCGFVVMKRLSDAIADGDRVLCVIHASAVNHDGPSGGLTVPNVDAQRKLLRAALEIGGLGPDDVAYVEAHGTGTRLGDPIEVAALSAEYELDRREGAPLYVGSVKTNIGHLETAAGVASLIKVAEAARRGVLPPQIHFHDPNPEIAWDRLRIEVLTEARPWPEGRAVAGVSAFGLSGTNAHLLIGRPPAYDAEDEGADERADEQAPWRSLLVLSAPTAPALARVARRWADWLSAREQPLLGDVCNGAALGRSHLGRRLAVLRAIEPERDLVIEALSAAADGRPSPRVLRSAQPRARPPRIAFVATCDRPPSDASRARLGRLSTVYQEAFDRCARAFHDESGVALESDVSDPSAWLVRARALAHALALAALWESWGIRPSLAMGAGAGELWAASVARALSPETAMRIVAALASPGANGHGGARLADRLARECRLAEVPIVSLRNGARLERELAGAGCWTEEALAASADTDAFARALGDSDQGFDLALCVGPPPAWMRELLSSHPEAAKRMAGIHRAGTDDGDEADAIARALAELYVAGAQVDFRAVHGRRVVVDLPSYPFERRRHWISAGPARRMAPSTRMFGPPSALPLGRERHFTAELSLAAFPFLIDHKVYERVVVPGAFHVAAMLAAASELMPQSVVILEDLLFRRALVLEPDEPQEYHLIWRGEEDGRARVEVYVRPRGDEEFRPVAEARAQTLAAAGAQARAASLPSLVMVDRAELVADSHQRFYEGVARRALRFGPMFQWLREIERRPGQASARLVPPIDEAEAARFALHPTLVDACFQLLALAEPSGIDGERTGAAYIPFAAEKIVLHGPPRGPLRGFARARGAREGTGPLETFSIDASICGEGDALVLSVVGLSAKRAPEERVVDSAAEWPAWLFELKWREVALSRAGAPARRIVACVDGSPLAGACCEALAAAGHAVTVLHEVTETALSPVLGAREPDCLLFVRERAPIDAPAHSQRLVLELFALVRALASRKRAIPVRLVTRGAVAIPPFASPSPDLAALWGLARALAGELPDHELRRWDLDPEDEPARAAASLVTLLESDFAEPEVGWRAGQGCVPRLVPFKRPARSGNARPLGGTVVVTGAFGALGRAVVERLAELGPEHIALLGRHPDPAFTRELQARLAPRSIGVSALAIDVADGDALEAALDRIRATSPPIRGVVHAAGIIEDALVRDLTDEAIERVLAPKVAGASHLHRLTKKDPIEMFVLYGSASTLFGAPGQSAYAAANAYLHALAERRRAEGLPALAVQWGPWAAGMAAGLESRWRRLGAAPIPVAEGTDLIAHAIGAQERWPAAPVVLRPSREGWNPAIASMPLLSELVEPSRAAAANEDRVFRDELLAMPAPRRHRALVRYLQRTVASMMGLPETDWPDPKAGVTELGMDSLMAVELRDRLQKVFGRPLAAAVVLEHPTLDALARFLVASIPADGASMPPPAAPIPPAAASGARDGTKVPGLAASDEELSALSDQELTRLLERELEGEARS